MKKSICLPRFAAFDCGEYSADLGRHFGQCSVARGRLFPAAQFAERVHGLVAPRFVTTILGAALLIALLCRGL